MIDTQSLKNITFFCSFVHRKHQLYKDKIGEFFDKAIFDRRDQGI